jgi:endonuclease/exonuclease/phosphatase family metal-dependent hydrolase
MKTQRSVWVCFCLTVFAMPSGGAETLTLATYNIENYGPANRVTESGYRKDYPKPEAAKQALRSVLRAINVDVLVLQEMGGQIYLDELRRDLSAEGLVYPHAVLLAGGDVDRHVALLSKRPLIATTQHTDMEMRYFGQREGVKRGLLEAKLAVADGELTIFALHLKSRYTDRPDDPLSSIRRASEATAIRDRVLLRCPDPATTRFVVLGDCNDDKASKALTFLQQRGKTAIAELLPAADSRGESWTHAYRKNDAYTRVDHVLVSAALRPVVVGGVARIYDGAGWHEASDHRPVIVTLAFTDKK